MSRLRIHQSPENVANFVAEARKASDANTNALGFVRAGMFERYAQQGKLWIAVNEDDEYVGHLLFDYSYPRAAVLQIFSTPEWRGRGVAKGLLETLKKAMEADRFLFIRASVAEDLTESNRFWETCGFYIAKRRRGGATTGRVILDRIHELDSPQLFARSGLALRPSDSLGIGMQPLPTTPAFMVDLNVVFDVAHKRVHSEDAEKLLHASHSGECRVLISAEMLDELSRHAKDARTDPMLRMMGALPRIPVPKDSMLDAIAPGIAKALFPEKQFPGGLSSNDRSDVRHLATAINCSATAFVTRDQRILDAAGVLERGYGLKVLHPEQLWELNPSFSQEALAESGRDGFFEMCALSEDSQEAHEFLLKSGANPIDIATAWLPGRNRNSAVSAVRINGKLLALSVLANSDPQQPARKLRIAVLEGHERVGTAARLLLQRGCNLVAQDGCLQLNVEMLEKQSSLRETAFRMGFRATSAGNVMAKLVLAQALTPQNWAAKRDYLKRSVGMLLPKDIPAWSGALQLLELHCPDGERRHVTLSEMESHLSPALFCMAGRPATVASIRPKYSEALLGSHKQLSLAPQMEAATHGERLYLSAASLLGQFERDGLIFFYESQAKGAQAIIAVARIMDVYLIRRDEIGEESLRRSVLSADNIGEIGSAKDKAACLFDNLIFLPTPVALKFLEEDLGYHSARLTSAGRLNSLQASRILEKGFTGA